MVLEAVREKIFLKKQTQHLGQGRIKLTQLFLIYLRMHFQTDQMITNTFEI